MALNKSQTVIMDRAKARPDLHVSAEMFGGRGPGGGRISGGVREYNAKLNLISKGLLAKVATSRETSCPGNGYTIHHYIIRAKLAVVA